MEEDFAGEVVDSAGVTAQRQRERRKKEAGPGGCPESQVDGSLGSFSMTQHKSNHY